MIPTPRVLESITRVTPLAVRFWDEVAQATISDGLRVVAYANHQPDRRLRPIENRHRTFVWSDLPGLREQEYGAGDQDYWATPPPTHTFTIEVQDDAARFLPFSFEVVAPFRDVITWQCLTAAGPFTHPAGTVPLFSSSVRPVPAVMAAIRLEVHRDQFDAQLKAYPPAAWAMIEAYQGANFITRTLADEQGRAILIFPYPDLPAGDLGHPFVKHTWPINLRAYYHPTPPKAAAPNLCTVLSQGVTKLWSKLLPATELTQVTLPFGQPVTIPGPPPAKPPDTLLVWITPV